MIRKLLINNITARYKAKRKPDNSQHGNVKEETTKFIIIAITSKSLFSRCELPCKTTRGKAKSSLEKKHFAEGGR